jgi:hypothetical protein
MRTIACLPTLEMRRRAPGRSETRSEGELAPSEPTEPEYSVAPGVIGSAIAWLAFFALVIAQALATNYGETLRNIAMYLH